LTGAAILSGVVGMFRIRNLEEKRPSRRNQRQTHKATIVWPP